MLFLKWVINGREEHTPLFVPDRIVKLDTHIDCRSCDTEEPLKLTLYGKTIFAELVEYGSFELEWPNQVKHSAERMTSSFTCKLGQFSLTASVSIVGQLDIESDTAEGRRILGDYLSAVRDMKPFGEQGLAIKGEALNHLRRLKGVTNESILNLAVNNLAELDGSMALLAEETDAYSTAMKRVLEWSLGPSPMLLSTRGARAYVNGGPPMFPMLGIEICRGLDQMMSYSSDMAEKFIADVCVMIIASVKSPTISDAWLVNFLSSEYYCISHMDTRYSCQLLSLRSCLLMMSKEAIHVYLTRTTSMIRDVIFNVARLQDIINHKNQMLDQFSIPKYISREILLYLYDTIDYYVSATWLLDSTGEIHASDYSSRFPGYNWPYITNLEKIVQNADAIIEGKFALKELPHEFRGKWLGLALKKVNLLHNKGYSDKSIDSLVDESFPIPLVVSIKPFVEKNPSFSNPVMQIGTPVVSDD